MTVATSLIKHVDCLLPHPALQALQGLRCDGERDGREGYSSPHHTKNAPMTPISRTLQQLHEHYVIEQELADRLRASTKIFKPQSTFMEVGAGDGAVAAGVARFLRRAYGFDVTRDLIRTDNALHTLLFVVMNGLTVPLQPCSVDIAYSNQMMEHLHPEDALDQLHSIYEVLTSGGFYVCITPSRKRTWGWSLAMSWTRTSSTSKKICAPSALATSYSASCS